MFLLFLGYTQAYERYQSPLILKALLVGFFLAGLVVLGPCSAGGCNIVSGLEPSALFFSASASPRSPTTRR